MGNDELHGFAVFAVGDKVIVEAGEYEGASGVVVALRPGGGAVLDIPAGTIFHNLSPLSLPMSVLVPSRRRPPQRGAGKTRGKVKR